MYVFQIVSIAIAIIIMLLSAISYLKTKSFIENSLESVGPRVRRIGFGYLLLLCFFLVAYLIYLIKLIDKDKFNTEHLITVLLFFGSVFVYTTMYFLRRLLNGIWKAKLNQTDPLTGLLNREGVRIAFCGQDGLKNERCALLLIDLDNFKDINDTYGHAVGDEILRKAAVIIRNQIQAEDMAGRFGGDEFTVLLRNISEEEAVMIANNIREQIAKCCMDICTESQVGASIGIAYKHSECKGCYEKMFERADRAMYASKAQGKNIVTVDETYKLKS